MMTLVLRRLIFVPKDDTHAIRRNNFYSWQMLPSLLFLFACGIASAQGNRSERSTAEGAPSLARDTYHVLQNRYFKKALRPEIGISYGRLANESYATTSAWSLGSALFFNEWLGSEFRYTSYSASDSEDFKSLQAFSYCRSGTDCSAPNAERVKVTPQHPRLKKSQDVVMLWTPVYGKMNLLDYIILYTDLTFQGGVSWLSTAEGTKPALLWGIGERFYFAKRWTLRADAQNRLFRESLLTSSGKHQNTYSRWTISAGLSVFLLGDGGDL